MIDHDGFRPNVGIILLGDNGKVLWARRIRDDGWQFPQGGINSDETPEEAMYRELHEEVGLKPDQVSILGVTPGWLRYRLPKKLQRTHSKPLCIGQKQVWYLLRLLVDEEAVDLQATDHPEFGRWRWVNYWYPVNHVVSFKRNVYQQALKALEPFAREHWQSQGLKPPKRPQRSRSGYSAHPAAKARQRRLNRRQRASGPAGQPRPASRKASAAASKAKSASDNGTAAKGAAKQKTPPLNRQKNKP